MGRRLLSGGNLVLAALLLMIINILGNTLLTSTRLDLTEQKLYTLTEGSKKIVGDLSDTISLQYFFSDNLLRDVAPLKSYAQRVRELLQEYVNHSNGKLELKIIDPEPFSDEEDRAVQFGLRGIPVNEVGDQAYFGLAAVNTVDGEEVIPFFSPENEDVLEYELSRMIYNLDRPSRPKIGVISSHMVNGTPPGPKGGPPGPPWVFFSQIQDLFETRVFFNELAVIPESIDLLLVIHPNRLSDLSLSAIDQYLLKGGKAVLFLDPLSEVEIPPPSPFPMGSMDEPKLGSDIIPLLDAWGLEVSRDKVVGDRLKARQVVFSRDPTALPEEYLPWITLTEENFNPDDVITNKLNTINMAAAGALKIKRVTDLHIEPLIQSTDQAMEIDAAKAEVSPSPKELLREFQPSGEKYTLAARITGTAQTAFPDGQPERIQREGQEELPVIPFDQWIQKSVEPMNVILVTDSDMLHDRFWVRVQDFYGERLAAPFADNGAFLINALDNLSGSKDLISVRSRAAYARPFHVLVELNRRAENQFLAQEKQLQEKLRDTEKRLADLQTQEDGPTTTGRVSPEQQQEIAQFLREKMSIRKQLRDVQRDLRRDIDNLETRLKFFNIGLIPLLIALGTLAVGLVRMRRAR